MDHDRSLPQRLNVNRDFGGWKGIGEYGAHRILNPYLGLPLTLETEERAGVFRCPADRWIFCGYDPTPAFRYFGNSYETNYIIIGICPIGVPRDHRMQIHLEINKRTKKLKTTSISDPSHLALLGDNDWFDQWDYDVDECCNGWHGNRHRFNIAFLDGHVDFLQIHKGLYVTPEYRIQPFRDIDGIVYEYQLEKTCEE